MQPVSRLSYSEFAGELAGVVPGTRVTPHRARHLTGDGSVVTAWLLLRIGLVFVFCYAAAAASPGT
jgi:hypothetical protein